MSVFQYTSSSPIVLERLPHKSFDSLERFNPWNHDCTFEFTFPRKELPELLYDPRMSVPFEIDVDGRWSANAQAPRSEFNLAASQAQLLGEFGVFFLGASFERRDKEQRAGQASRLILSNVRGINTMKFTYRGNQANGVEGIALEALRIMAQSGLAVEGTYDASWWSVKCELQRMSEQAVALMFELVDRLGSGTVFEYFWNTSIVDPDIANSHALELYNRVAKSRLSADRIKVLFKLKFLDMRGLEVVRQLCEEETHYTVPLGTFRHRKKKATVGIHTSAEGYRLALQFKEEPTGDELQDLESLLGIEFNRSSLATLRTA